MKKFLTLLFLLSFTLLTGANLDIVAKGNSPYAIVYADRTASEYCNGLKEPQTNAAPASLSEKSG